MCVRMRGSLASPFWPETNPERLGCDNASSGLKAAHGADDLALLRGDRLHRQPRRVHQHHVGEFGIGFAFFKRHGARNILHRLHHHQAENALFVRGVRLVFLDYFDDPHHRFLFAGVIEKALIAVLHRLHVLPGDVVAHPAPGFALGALFLLHLPGPGLGFGLEQPVIHSLFNLLLINRVSASESWSSPFKRSAIASAMGSSILKARARWTRAGAVATPSAKGWTGASNSASVLPCPRLTPNEKLRELLLVAVSTRSPSPDRPIKVSRLAPNASPSRVNSAKLRARRAARAFSPSPMPSTTPQAMA